jgi:hypothetical protein
VFADINGDGKADYICIAKNGAASAWINTGPKAGTWTVLGEIRSSVGADRANVRFADLNGDGKADYLWLDKFDGSVRLWSNPGLFANKIDWASKGKGMFKFSLLVNINPQYFESR